MNNAIKEVASPASGQSAAPAHAVNQPSQVEQGQQKNSKWRPRPIFGDRPKQIGLKRHKSKDKQGKMKFLEKALQDGMAKLMGETDALRECKKDVKAKSPEREYYESLVLEIDTMEKEKQHAEKISGLNREFPSVIFENQVDDEHSIELDSSEGDFVDDELVAPQLPLLTAVSKIQRFFKNVTSKVITWIPEKFFGKKYIPTQSDVLVAIQRPNVDLQTTTILCGVAMYMTATFKMQQLFFRGVHWCAEQLEELLPCRITTGLEMYSSFLQYLYGGMFGAMAVYLWCETLYHLRLAILKTGDQTLVLKPLSELAREEEQRPLADRESILSTAQIVEYQPMIVYSGWYGSFYTLDARYSTVPCAQNFMDPKCSIDNVSLFDPMKRVYLDHGLLATIHNRRTLVVAERDVSMASERATKLAESDPSTQEQLSLFYRDRSSVYRHTHLISQHMLRNTFDPSQLFR